MNPAVLPVVEFGGIRGRGPLVTPGRGGLVARCVLVGVPGGEHLTTTEMVSRDAQFFFPGATTNVPRSYNRSWVL